MKQEILINRLKDISEFISKYGYPPTRKELCDIWSLISKSSSTHYLKIMQDKGYIVIIPYIARGIKITNKGQQILKIAKCR